MKYLTPDEFVALLWAEFRIRRSTKTLAKLRCIGGSAPFVKANRAVLYPVDTAREWGRSLLSSPMMSTSDSGHVAA